MAWTDFSDARRSVGLLSRSLEQGRLGHAYLFCGDSTHLLEGVARELALTVNCTSPSAQAPAGIPVAACGTCSSCRRIRGGLHPDVHWLRAESKTRIVKVEQVRELIHAVQLKPTEARYKVGIIVGADRLNLQAANAFLKTLEEPPSKSLLLLVTTEPDRLLETIVSRCLRLVIPGGGTADEAGMAWLTGFVNDVRTPSKSLLQRYLLLDRLLAHLGEVRRQAEAEIEERSMVGQYREADPSLKEQWEEEAVAATEAEYRQRRGQTLMSIQWWLRDVWLTALRQGRDTLALPGLAEATQMVADRIGSVRAMANLQLLEETQSLLHTNVQEALALEVAILRLEL